MKDKFSVRDFIFMPYGRTSLPNAGGKLLGLSGWGYVKFFLQKVDRSALMSEVEARFVAWLDELFELDIDPQEIEYRARLLKVINHLAPGLVPTAPTKPESPIYR